MRMPFIILLFLKLNLVYGQFLQGYAPEKTKPTREKRQNNIYEFLRQLLASSSNSNSGYPQNNYEQNIPQDFTQFYLNSGQERFVLNVNQAESKPTTIINNQSPEYYSSCPCEQYVRAVDGLACLCSTKQIFKKCAKSTVCVLKHLCENGLLLNMEYLQKEYINSQSELCDESTHICCLAPTEVRRQNNFEEAHEIYNHFVNSSVERLNNTVTKYIISGNVYLNNQNPDQYKTRKEETFTYAMRTNHQDIPDIIKPRPQGVQLSVEQQNIKINNDIPSTSVPITTNKVNELSYLSSENDNSVVSTTEQQSSQKTNPPNLIRPTRPPGNEFFTSQPLLFESKNKEVQTNDAEDLYTSEITTYRPKIKTSTSTTIAPEVSTRDILNTKEIISIFGAPQQNVRPQNFMNDATIFPGLLSTTIKPTGELTELNANQPSTEKPVGTSIIENISFVHNDKSNSLSQMDFPQSGLQLPMKNSEIFIRGKIEKLRNNTRKNATTGFGTTIGTRIIVEMPLKNTNVSIMVPVATEGLAQTLVNTEEMINTDYFLPQMMSASFVGVDAGSVASVPANTNPILKICPSAMKCVQEMYCTPDGIVSTVPVILTTEEELKKNLLLNCGDEASGQIGKCCLDRNI